VGIIFYNSVFYSVHVIEVLDFKHYKYGVFIFFRKKGEVRSGSTGTNTINYTNIKRQECVRVPAYKSTRITGEIPEAGVLLLSNIKTASGHIFAHLLLLVTNRAK
jgi:hypothetical protein